MSEHWSISLSIMETVEYVAKHGRDAGDVSNVAHIITRWFFYTVFESPRVQMSSYCPDTHGFSNIDQMGLRHTIEAILDRNRAEWECIDTSGVPFSFVIRSSRCVVIRVARMRLEVTIHPDSCGQMSGQLHFFIDQTDNRIHHHKAPHHHRVWPIICGS